MSDFLQTLIARKNPGDLSSVLQPRLPSLFESMEGEGDSSLPIEATAANSDHRPVAIPAPDLQPEAALLSRHLTTRPEPDRPPQSETTFDPPRSWSRAGRAMDDSDQAATKTIHPPERYRSQEAARVLLPPLDLPVPSSRHVQPSSGRPDPSPTVQPAASTGAPEPRPAHPQDTIIPSDSSFQPDSFLSPRPVSSQTPSRPTPGRNVDRMERETMIRVHIGRIEVRAVMDPTRERAIPRTPKPKITLSLDDYLQQRNEGKR